MRRLTMKESQRAYVYRIALALSPLAVIHGLVAQDEINYWQVLVGAILAVPSGLATAFTNRKSSKTV